MTRTFPIVRIERWTGLDGWWTFKVLYVAREDADADPLDAEFPTIEDARIAARRYATAMGDCPIVEDV